jgi:putative alpha-1,2-mannosidase
MLVCAKCRTGRQLLAWVILVENSIAYQATPDGLCSDEDTGQTSAWYVFSALGFYLVCPGDPNYLIGSPLFDKAILTLAGGKTFTIAARNNGAQKYYIQSATLNDGRFDKTNISHEQITNDAG